MTSTKLSTKVDSFINTHETSRNSSKYGFRPSRIFCFSKDAANGAAKDHQAKDVEFMSVQVPPTEIRRALAPNIVFTQDKQLYKLNKFLPLKMHHSVKSGLSDISCSISGEHYAQCIDDKWYLNNKELVTYQETMLILPPKIRFVHLGYNHYFFVTEENHIYGIGEERYGLMAPSNGDGKGTVEDPMRMMGDFDKIEGNIVSICCGFAHVIALTDLGELVGCGYSYHGELGLGKSIDVSVPISLSLSDKRKTDQEIDMIASGTFHTLWKTKSNQIYVSGRVSERPFGPSVDDKFDLLSPVLLDIQDVLGIGCDSRSRASWIFMRDHMKAWGKDLGNDCTFGKEGECRQERIVEYPDLISSNDICQTVNVRDNQVIVCFGQPKASRPLFAFFQQIMERRKFVDLHCMFI